MAEEKKEGEAELWLRTAFGVWNAGRWCAQKLPLADKFFREVRRRRDVDVLERLHENVFQAMRRLTVAMAKNQGSASVSVLLPMANDLCTEMHGVMADRLLLKTHDLHVCWKMLRRSEDASCPYVQSLGRSRPFDDGRPDRGRHALTCHTSTIYAALSGENDGETNWRLFPAFCSNNLPKYAAVYKTDRHDWQKFYKSALVFPLRYVRDLESEDYDTIGFLAFNSQNLNAFAEVPEIFEYRDRVTDYRNKLSQSPTYHLGAIFAETLSAYLHGVYNVRSDGSGSSPREPAERITTATADSPNRQLIDNGSAEAARLP